jgi:hypothetical protein
MAQIELSSIVPAFNEEESIEYILSTIDKIVGSKQLPCVLAKSMSTIAHTLQ